MSMDHTEEVGNTDWEAARLFAQLAHKADVIGGPALARALFDASAAHGRRVSDPDLQDDLRSHLANEYASVGEFEISLRELATIQDTSEKIKTAWKLANKLAKAGRKDDARLLLDESAESAYLVRDAAARAELLSGTGANYRHVDAATGVSLVYESFGIIQMLDDAYSRGILLNEAGAHFIDVKHPLAAKRAFALVEQALDEMRLPLEKARVLAMMGGEKAEKGDRLAAPDALEQALHWAQMVEEGELKHDVISEIARNFGQSFQFDRGVEVAASIPNPYHSAEGYIRIAKNLIKQKTPEHEVWASQLLRLSKELVDRIEIPYRKVVVLRKLATEYSSLKDRDRAADMLRSALAVATNTYGFDYPAITVF
jgi:tetratricopeptide (TPR) repeat protein